jgi:CBS domain-containing protein
MTASNPLPSGASWERKPVCVDRDTTILNASRLMRTYETEQLVVTQRPRDVRVPLGVVSARDIVTRIVAAGLDPAVMTAGDIVWADTPETAMVSCALDALKTLIAAGNPLLPVLDQDGGLTGFTTLDELLDAMGRGDTA